MRYIPVRSRWGHYDIIDQNDTVWREGLTQLVQIDFALVRGPVVQDVAHVEDFDSF